MPLSGHGDGVMAHQDMLNGEGVQSTEKANRAEDYHAMLATILESHIQLQKVNPVSDWTMTESFTKTLLKERMPQRMDNVL